ncbi:MAG TPA: dolichyl-phosphate beta-glucosyltransferase [Patescibacteria group bacterium]|nr:dolichyl-phosphate beta-glucosyltransferase [Patescibacteria group bacterium]
MNPFLSVVIPAYNEETNIRLGSLDKVSRYLEHQSYAWEVVLVDDGSTDATPELMESFTQSNPGFRAIHNPHKGKAGTVISGVLQAKGKLVVFTDLDQATPITELEDLIPWFDRGYDVVIGSRNRRREGAPISRVIMARGFMFLRSIILGLRGITDTQCGFKGFRRHVAKEIFSRLSLYNDHEHANGPMVTAGFDIEVLYLAKQRGYKIKEVPVEWHYVETRRVNPLKDSWQGFIDMLRIRMNAWWGNYK